MPKIVLPRAFPSFDPMMHVSETTPGTAVPVLSAVGLDIGVGAPCVALHGLILSDHHLHVHACSVATDVGLDHFVASGQCGEPSDGHLIAAERAVDARCTLNAQSPRQLMESYGLSVVACRTPPAWRLDAINHRLALIEGGPRLTMDPRCEPLIATLVGYRAAHGPDRSVRTSTPGHQHVVDALGYLVELAARWFVAADVLHRGILIDESA